MSNKKKNYSKISTEKVKAEQNVEAEIVTSIYAPVEPVADTVEETPVTPKVVTGVVTGCVKLNVRNNPSDKAYVECVIDKGTEVIVDLDRTTNGFYFVRKDNTTQGFNGWCMKKYITIKK